MYPQLLKFLNKEKQHMDRACIKEEWRFIISIIYVLHEFIYADPLVLINLSKDWSNWSERIGISGV
jgi:hypothetical protein